MTPMTIPEILAASGLNKTELSRRFQIPYTTVKNWCTSSDSHRECPVYIRLMMMEILGLS
jgi:DNA-binding transcriptional regulator YiaG